MNNTQGFSAFSTQSVIKQEIKMEVLEESNYSTHYETPMEENELM